MLCYQVVLIFAVFILPLEAKPLLGDNGNLKVTPLLSDFTKLFSAHENFTQLNHATIHETIFKKEMVPTLWIISFYANWCGHCKRTAPVWRNTAIAFLPSQPYIKLAALDCGLSSNTDVCSQFGITGFPTLLVCQSDESISTCKHVPVTDASKHIDPHIYSFLYENLPSYQPVLTFLLHFTNLEAAKAGLEPHPTNDLAFVVNEPQGSLSGFKLQFRHAFQYPYIKIANVPKLDNSEDTVELYQIQRSKDLIFLLSAKVNDSIEIPFGEDINKNPLELPPMAPKYPTPPHQNFLTSSNTIKEVERNTESSNPVYEIDLIAAIKYSLYNEIPLSKPFSAALSKRGNDPRINNLQMEAKQTFETLVGWVKLLGTNYGGPSLGMKAFLSQLSIELSFSRDKLLQIPEKDDSRVAVWHNILMNAEFKSEFKLSALPTNFVHCKGSSPQFRAYPCSLWLLIHHLSSAPSPHAITGVQFVTTIRSYIYKFFGCRECAENFAVESRTLNNDIQTASPIEAKSVVMLGFWKIHNSVNKRLAGSDSEDPAHPKIQWPSSAVCPKCEDFAPPHILPFLTKFFHDDLVAWDGDPLEAARRSKSSSNMSVDAHPDHQSFPQRHKNQHLGSDINSEIDPPIVIHPILTQLHGVNGEDMHEDRFRENLQRKIEAGIITRAPKTYDKKLFNNQKDDPNVDLSRPKFYSLHRLSILDLISLSIVFGVLLFFLLTFPPLERYLPRGLRKPRAFLCDQLHILAGIYRPPPPRLKYA